MTFKLKISPEKRIVITSIVLFGFSLSQKAITYNDYDGINNATGLNFFLMGSTAILGGGLLEWLVWLANPLSLLSILFFLQKKQKARTTSKVALTLALSFMFWQHILISENGRQAEILNKNFGYWLWLLSIAMLTFGIHKYVKETSNSNELNDNNDLDVVQDLIQENNFEKLINLDIEQVQEYKNKYKHKSIEELTQLSHDTRFTLEARTAAQQMIEEEKENQV